jgi:hypothetical protein
MNIVKSHLPNKKYDAIFKSGRIVPFGATGYTDFTQTGDKDKRRLYRQRHAMDNINNPFTAGSLSYHILWGDSMRIQENLKVFKKKFGL